MANSFKSFEELECYQVARTLRRLIAAEVKNWPKDEKFLLVSQVLRSSRSVTANIAEGFGRHHHQENMQYCRQARGSLTETLEHLITSHDEGYIDCMRLEELRGRFAEALKLLNGYIAYLKKAAAGV